MSESDESNRAATRLDKPERQSKPKIEVDFGPRYRVLGMLGKGGMGAVFRAYDSELKCEVALKIVTGDGDAALARFRREIALARKVTNPNVLRVYDLGDYEGQRFLSMELVDGEDLAALMKREGRLPLPRALSLFRQVCQGLAAAHEQGVVHRDLKPQNVLVDREDKVRVADFGLARSIGDSGLTASGAIMGSPTYMSPEQVKGEDVDERSDIYSLGVMLYQLVSGKPPFEGTTVHSLMEMRLHKKPRPLREVAPDAPAYIEAIVERCLRVDPAGRYPTMRALLADLDGGQTQPVRKVGRRAPVALIAGGIAVAGAIAGGVIWRARSHHESPPAPPVAAGSSAPVVAPPAAPKPGELIKVLVLGIENRTSDPNFDSTLDYVFDYALRRSTLVDPVSGHILRGLATELASTPLPLDLQLASKVIERDGGRVLSLRGSTVPKGSGYTLSITLSDPAGQKLFEQSADATSLADVVATAAKLASALREHLGEHVPAEDRERSGLSSSIEADHEFAIARALAASGDPNAAIAHYQQALAKDPGFALAHSGLGTVYSNILRHVDSTEQFQLALKAIDQMGERDRYKTLGDYYNLATGEYARAAGEYEKLLAKWPTDIAAETNVAIAYMSAHDLAKAHAAAVQAAKHHPHDVTIRSNVAGLAINVGNIEEGVEVAQQVIKDFPRPLVSVHEYLAIAEYLLGHRPEALAAYAKFEQLDPSWGATARADLHMTEGRLTDAAKVLEAGIASDRAQGLVDAGELKLAMLAEVRWRQGDKAAALAAAAKVSKDPQRVFTAVVVQLAAGDDKHAQASIARLAADIAIDPRALAKYLEGESQRVHGKAAQAMLTIQEGLRIADMWPGHFLLARAALDAGRFADAYSEIKTCVTRTGEVALGFDDVPSLRYVAPLTYYLARAQEGLGSPDAQASYKAFLAMQPESEKDPLVDDARKRVH